MDLPGTVADAASNRQAEDEKLLVEDDEDDVAMLVLAATSDFLGMTAAPDRVRNSRGAVARTVAADDVQQLILRGRRRCSCGEGDGERDRRRSEPLSRACRVLEDPQRCQSHFEHFAFFATSDSDQHCALLPSIFISRIFNTQNFLWEAAAAKKPAKKPRFDDLIPTRLFPCLVHQRKQHDGTSVVHRKGSRKIYVW